jgi:hypothetical protein
MLFSLAVLLAWAEPAEVSDQTLVYFNARLAMREDRPLDAAKYWLLRNAVEDHTGRVSPHDSDFHSVTWAALGQMGVCQDGHPTDEEGAGLWPIALHNWVVRNRSRRVKVRRSRPFDAFEVGRQQRFISIDDVLSAEELNSVRLYRWGCLRPRLALFASGESVTAKLSDRQVAGRFLQRLLERSRDTLARDRVRGLAAIDARLFDLHLQLTELARREAAQKARERGRRGREVGLSRESVIAMQGDEPAYAFSSDSEPARILRESVDWPVEEWMSLTDDRRLFLFDHATAYGGDAAALEAVASGILDELIVQREGDEIEKWVARLGPDRAPDIWGGDRGRRLMAVDAASGFGERGVVALHRGVHHLERGDLKGAMRAFAYALQHASESVVGEEVHGLSLRWLSYVASQFEITDELLITLHELVPRREYATLLEDLMWGAAFRADRVSFERGIRNQDGRGALERRVEVLYPLAKGNVGQFSTGVRDGLAESPSETLRFLTVFVQRLELEDAAVRTAHLPTLRQLRGLLDARLDLGGRQGRTVDTLLRRIQAIESGLGGLGLDVGSRERARSLDPDGEVFAGAVRLAPSDPLPWPFAASSVSAPSAFTPLQLVPVEWRDAKGDWVYGWSIRG